MGVTNRLEWCRRQAMGGDLECDLATACPITCAARRWSSCLIARLSSCSFFFFSAPLSAFKYSLVAVGALCLLRFKTLPRIRLHAGHSPNSFGKIT
jgi:hypothetical protein